MGNNYPKDGQQGFQKGQPVVPTPPVITDKMVIPAQEPAGDVSAETLAEYGRYKDILDSEVAANPPAEKPLDTPEAETLRDIYGEEVSFEEIGSYLGSPGGSSGVLPNSFRRTNYSGYLLSDRNFLLSSLRGRGVTPLHERVVFEHVTYQYPDKETAPECQRVEIVGHAEADGVQAVLIAIDGETTRPSGGFYHVTLSLAEGHKPAESNRMLENTPIIMFDEPIDVTVARF